MAEPNFTACPGCKHTVSSKVAVCPFCRAVLKPEVVAAAHAPGAASQPPKAAAPVEAPAPAATPAPATTPAPAPSAPPQKSAAPRPRIQRPAPPPAQDDSLSFPVRIALVALAIVLVLGVVYGAVRRREKLAGAGPVLCVVNASAEPSLSIWIDGQQDIKSVPRIQTESARDARTTALSPGPHQIEARSDAGAVVESANFTLSDETTSFLFAPRHGANLCFALVSSRGPVGAGEIWEPLTQDLWSIKGHVDRWLEPLPSGGQRPADLAVRMYACSQRAP